MENLEGQANEIVPLNEIAEANQLYGALTEGLYFTGFTFERVMGHVLHLLKDDLWTKVGNGFSDVSVFMRSLPLDQFKVVSEQRKEFVERVKELQAVSNRAIADALGVDNTTINEDVRGGNPPAKGRGAQQSEEAAGGNPPPGAADGRRDAARINQRDEREERLKEKLKSIAEAAELKGLYSVIYADPPWEDDFGPNSRQIENHYFPSTDEEIEALGVPGVAADDAILFMWAIPHMLPTALKIMEAWSFSYRTHLIWAKDQIGLGQYVRNEHELLLIGRKGGFPPPPESDRVGSVVEAPVGEHSVKPAIFAEMIERWYPGQPKLEMFCRGAGRPGWSVWGNEAESKAEAAE